MTKPSKASPIPKDRPTPRPRFVFCGEFFDGEAETLGRELEDLFAGEEFDCESVTPNVGVLPGNATDFCVG